MRRALRPSRADAVGLAAVGVWLAWVFVSAALNGRPAPVASAFVVGPLVVMLGIALGRLAGSVPRRAEPPARPWPRPLAWLRAGGRWVDAVVLLLVVLLLPGTPLRLAPGPPPLGYENANTAAATQLLALCGLLALDDTVGRPRRLLLGLGAIVAGYNVVVHGSQAGIATAIPVALLVVVLLMMRPRRTGWAIVVGLVTWLLAAASVFWLATRGSWPTLVLRAFDPVRKRMWEAAVALWGAHPWIGGGPGSYVPVNPYGHDTDTMAAHSSLLQVGSELGVVGVALLCALIIAGLAQGARARPGATALMAAAWTALWIHSLVDHLFDYPGLPLLAGLVIGFASAPSDTEIRPPADRRGR